MAPEDDTEEHEERAEERTAEERAGEREEQSEERPLRAGSTWEREREPERGGTSDRPVGQSRQRSGYGQASETYGDRYARSVGSENEQGRPSGRGETERVRRETTGRGEEEAQDEARTERRESEQQEEREGGEQREEVPRYGGPVESTRRSRGRWGRNENELRAYERRIDRAIERQRDLQRDKSGQPYHRGRR